MAKFNNTRRRVVKQLDPKTLRKRSEIAERRIHNMVIVGQREPTPTGYVIPGHSGKLFDTYAEVLLPGASTAMFRHPKKEKVVRILSGDGFVVLEDGEASVERRLQAGDEVILKANVAYRFSTTSNQGLQMHVVQEPKYAAKLETISGPGSTVNVTADVLVPGERVEPPSGIRKGSKAVQQQQRLRNGRIEPSQVINPTGVDVSRSAVQTIMNARPSHGHFDEEGAG